MFYITSYLKQVRLGFSAKTRKKPRLLIAECFSNYALRDHLMYIHTWMDSVNSGDFWKENTPSDLLFYCEKLKELINAAYVIHKEKKKRETAMDLLREKNLDPETNLWHPALYFGWQAYGTIWDFFPRSLDLEEYIDPYLALAGFFKFMSLEKWHEELYILLIDGLTGFEAPGEPIQGTDLSLTRRNLCKLVEATHLIDVRETDKIAGKYPKRRLYTLDTPYPEVLLKVLGQEPITGR